MTSLAVGFGLGFFVGAQPGPVSLLCIRSVLRGALASGIAIGIVLSVRADRHDPEVDQHREERVASMHRL